MGKVIPFPVKEVEEKVDEILDQAKRICEQADRINEQTEAILALFEKKSEDCEGISLELNTFRKGRILFRKRWNLR